MAEAASSLRLLFREETGSWICRSSFVGLTEPSNKHTRRHNSTTYARRRGENWRSSSGRRGRRRRNGRTPSAVRIFTTHLSSRVRAVVWNSPHNPSSTLLHPHCSRLCKPNTSPSSSSSSTCTLLTRQNTPILPPHPRCQLELISLSTYS